MSQAHQLTKLLFHCTSEPSADTLYHAQSHIPCTMNRVYTNSKSNTSWRFHSVGERGRDVTQESFIQGDSAQRSNPLPFYILFLTERYPFCTPSIDKGYRYHIPTFDLCTLFKIHCTLNKNKSQNQNVFSTFSQA